MDSEAWHQTLNDDADVVTEQSAEEKRDCRKHAATTISIVLSLSSQTGDCRNTQQQFQSCFPCLHRRETAESRAVATISILFTLSAQKKDYRKQRCNNHFNPVFPVCTEEILQKAEL